MSRTRKKRERGNEHRLRGLKVSCRNEHILTLMRVAKPSGECEGAVREPYVSMVNPEGERSEPEGPH